MPVDHSGPGDPHASSVRAALQDVRSRQLPSYLSSAIIYDLPNGEQLQISNDGDLLGLYEYIVISRGGHILRSGKV